MTPKRLFLLAAFAALCAATAFTIWQFRNQGHREPALPVYGVVEPFQLTAQDGAPWSTAAVSDRVWVADFVFTHCAGPCPLMTTQMARLHARFGPEAPVRFVTISVDPERDTPEVLASYADQHGADVTRWKFLTGDRAEIHRIATAVFLQGSVTDVMVHSQKFTLVDRQGRIRGFYEGTDPADVDRLEHDIRALMAARY